MGDEPTRDGTPCLSRYGSRVRARARDARRDTGQALLEFAIVLPVLVLLVMGIIDMGRAFSYWINETQLAGEAVRWIVVDKDLDAPTLEEYVKERASSNELADALTVTVCYPDTTNAIGDPVRVTIQSPFEFMEVVLGGLNVTLTATATMRLEKQPTNGGIGADVAGAGAC